MSRNLLDDIYDNEYLTEDEKIDIFKSIKEIYSSDKYRFESNIRLDKEDINLMCTWDRTPQGHAYWEEMHEKFMGRLGEDTPEEAF